MTANSSSYESHPVRVVDTIDAAQGAVHSLVHHPEITLDIEGAWLGGEGTVQLVLISTRDGKVYCFDALAIGAPLFSMLAPLLESQRVKKLCYDCRNDAAVLWHKHRIRLAGVVDLQVAYTLLYQAPGDAFLKGLQVALRTPGIVPAREELVRATALKDRFKREMKETQDRGGLFATRPLERDLLEYCATDVRYLFRMYDVWGARLHQIDWQRLTADRMAPFLASPTPQRKMAYVDFARPRGGRIACKRPSSPPAQEDLGGALKRPYIMIPFRPATTA